MKKIKYFKILACSCIAMIAFTFTGCADHTAYDKNETAQQMPAQIPNRETDDGMPENGNDIQKPQSDMPTENGMPKKEETPEKSVEPDMKPEPETELSSGSDTTAENDEPVAITQMDYASFQSRMTAKEWEGLQQYFPVLKDNAAFELTSFDYDNYTLFDKDGKVTEDETSAVLCQYNSKEMTDLDHYAKTFADRGITGLDEMMIHEVQVFDLDGDGIQELIMYWGYVWNVLVFHYEDGKFYGWETVYRGFEVLQTSGVYIASGGAAYNDCRRIRFDQGTWIEEILSSVEWNKYFIGGEEVDETAYQQNISSYKTGKVTAYEPKQYTGKL